MGVSPYAKGGQDREEGSEGEGRRVVFSVDCT